MEKILSILLLLVIFTSAKTTKSAPSLVDTLRKNFLELELKLWKEVTSTAVNEVSPSKETTPEVALIAELEKFGDTLQNNFTDGLNDGLEVLETVPLYKEVEALLRSVYGLYESFRRFQRQQTSPGRIISPKQAWLDFTETILYHRNYPIPKILDKIGNYIKDGKLFDRILKDLDSNSVCMSKQSPNQLLYNLYNTISLTQIKGYAMIQFAYTLLELYNKGTYTVESKLARQAFINRSLETAEEMKRAMDKASTHYWRCDPDQFKKDENYLEITQLLQGYIQNEVDLNPDGTCKENCGYYQFTKSHSCYDNLYCRQQRRCKGRIFNCQFVDSDMWVCPSSSSSGRRYNYIEYENGRILGQKGSCPNHRVKVDSWWRWLFWHCSYCMCLCDEEGIYSDRYFSLLPAVSNVSENMIVTGLRFIKKNRIIHLQIQQGKLLKHGVIDETTIEWVPVSDMKISDRFIYNKKHYFTLNWENRALDLDDLQGDNEGLQSHHGYVLTGVKFKSIGAHLNFEIQVTPFDFETGILTNPTDQSQWIDNPSTEFSPTNKRTKYLLGKVDVPTKAKAHNTIKTKHNQFLDFMHTDFDKDAAQTTVPFLDSQPVIPVIPMPLSGAGIYFKSTGDYGGFIGLKVFTYNFGNHLDYSLEVPEEDIPDPEPQTN
ncbi:protein of unknown function (DUF4803) [Popillia japonica]|uniref:Uncharacterized protein n=1 Tax=Popillia japonica TaxID=7064 RepID=A0AAW1MGU4_POPJA